jgi:DNA replication ATP-dependent helicase Dna2
MEHRAQTILYTLLASERYGIDVKQGLLYYTQSEEVISVEKGWNELRGLIGGRNLLVGWMIKRIGGLRGGKRHDKSDDQVRDWEAKNDEKTRNGERSVEDSELFLPPTIDDERACNRCYVLDACMLYRKVRLFYLSCLCLHNLAHRQSRT